jgi:hypothetical protein
VCQEKKKKKKSKEQGQAVKKSKMVGAGQAAGS